MRTRTKQTLHQLLATHFQTKNADRELLSDRNILDDIHGERGLAHARPSRNYNHLAWMHSVGHPIQFRKTSSKTGDAASVLVEFLDRLDRVHHLIFHREQLAFEAIFAHGENALFHFVEQIVYLVLFLVSAADALGGGGNDLAENVLVANDFEIVADVRGSGNEGEQTRHKRRAAHGVKKMPITQDLSERHKGDRLRRVPEIDQDIVNRPVRGHVKVFLVNFLDAFRDRFSRRNQHRPEHPLLRVNAMRGCTVNILRRTCRRYGNNFFAASRRRTSASAISRFTRLLSCPSGRLSRHLFRFFFLFFLSSKKWAALFLRFRGHLFLRGFRLFRRRLHVEFELRSDIVMQLNLHLVVAGVFDRPFKEDLVPINLDANLVLEAITNVLRRNRTKSFSRFACCECEDYLQLLDASDQFLRLV